ncbi:unnamed protein product, partial [marine sediment metagenome]
HIIKGTVTKLTNFGAFVELEPDLEGLLHISELADHKIEKPQDIVKEGDEVEVKILKVDTEARKIGLSLRRARWAAEEQATEAAQQQSRVTAPSVPSDSDTEVAKPQEKASEPEDLEQAEPKKRQEDTEQALPEQTQESEETKSQASGDSSEDKKADADTDN